MGVVEAYDFAEKCKVSSSLISFPYFLFGLLLGAFAVAVALAFGLGGREIAAREIEKWLKSMK